MGKKYVGNPTEPHYYLVGNHKFTKKDILKWEAKDAGQLPHNYKQEFPYNAQVLSFSLICCACCTQPNDF